MQFGTVSCSMADGGNEKGAGHVNALPEIKVPEPNKKPGV